jgi:acyl carrier protein
MALTSESILDYLKNNLGLDPSTIQPDTPLCTSNLVDSFTLIDLIMFVESEIGVKIDSEDVQIENFDSITSILEFAKKKQGGLN